MACFCQLFWPPKLFTPTGQFFYTDISVISVTFSISEDDGDGEDAWGGASDVNDDAIVDDHVIVPEQRLVKRPLVTEWCLDEDGQDEQGLPEGQNLQMYSALQRL